MEKDKMLEELLASNLSGKFKGFLYSNYYRMENIKKRNMVKMLNKLDELSEDCENKRLMREMILDNYNDLPRIALELINEFIKE